MNITKNKSLVLGALLAALMAATRMHHFGSALHLPDASLAVFLLAGFFIVSPLLFGMLMLEAVALDYVAITQLGVDNYCVTPAYWFLVPTYAVLWFAGRSYARVHQDSLRSMGIFSAISFAAVNVAFVISNGSFYLLSGNFAKMNIAEYAARVAQYYVPYVSGAVVYLVPAVMLYVLITRRSAVVQASHAG
ncbi:MAG: hypothetical protein NTY60_01840 [Proteobacteria bacterium]|nr:hypothetical protein [Pseudomonadota bacterium]